MDSKIRDITEMLLNKRDLVSDILNLTETTEFFGDQDDPDKYISLMDKRQVIIDQIILIDSELEKEPNAILLKNPTKELENNLYSINHAIKEFANKIIALDKANNKYSDKIIDSLKKELKSIKDTKNLTSVYINEGNQGGTYFDTKK